MIAALVRADAIHLPLRDESVDLVVTSPPYFALRSYQDDGTHYAGQIGSEATARKLSQSWRVFESGHAAKAVSRTWAERQGELL